MKNKFFIAAMLLIHSIQPIAALPFDMDYKRKVLEKADLAGQSYDELLSDSDFENETFIEQKNFNNKARCLYFYGMWLMSNFDVSDIDHLGLTISANCTAKNTSYILSNALKIKTYGKKAIKIDPFNGGGYFLVSAQDIYAPTPFCKLNKGRKAMTKYLNDMNLRKEKFETFNISCAVAYSWYKKKKYRKAQECYIQCKKLYPENYSVNLMLKKIQDKLSH